MSIAPRIRDYRMRTVQKDDIWNIFLFSPIIFLRTWFSTFFFFIFSLYSI